LPAQIAFCPITNGDVPADILASIGNADLGSLAVIITITGGLGLLC
jgi:hypothetical protein